MINTVEVDRYSVAASDVQEMSAKDQLRRQIGRLEMKLARLAADGCRTAIGGGENQSPGSARMLGLKELEEERDRLVHRLRTAENELSEIRATHARAHSLLQALLADPASHKWIRVSNEDLGKPGCRHWHSRPRFGILGMLFGWWRVKMSSGCP